MMRNLVLTVSVSAAVVGMVLGVGGAALAASAGGTRTVGPPRTLFLGHRSIYAFAEGADRISWVSPTDVRRSIPDCEMYVRTLRTGQTSHAPLPKTGCGLKPAVDFGPQVPVLANGVAAWVKGSSCGISECFWKVATITGGEAKARVVDQVDIGCPPPACGLRHALGGRGSRAGAPFPRPALAGHGNLLVYSSGGLTVDKVFRIVGKNHGLFAIPPGLSTDGGIDSLEVGGGAVEVDSTVLDVGDGCGCVDSPVWSPDGSQIAYLHGQFANPQFNPYPPDAALAVMNADGSGRHDLTTPTVLSNESLNWSPDGKQIAYVSASGAITVVNTDGSGSLQLGPGYDPTWSPDGTKIAFVSAGCNNTTAAISVMNPDGTNIHQLTSFAPGCVDPTGMAWSPDGARIAFSLANSNGGETLEMMNADGTNVHPLGTNALTMANCSSCRADEPSWSQNSSQIVFRASDDSNADSGLWVIGADGSNVHQLTNNQTDEHPSWSPDGSTIVFGSDRNDPYYGANEAAPELYLVNPDGSNLRPLSFTTPTEFQQQKNFYSANGKQLPSFPGVPTLAGEVAAVGSTSSSGTHEITLFNKDTGAQLAQVQVGTGSGPFTVAGADPHWIVFRIGRAISALNTSSHKTIRLAQAAARPIDLAVAGRRVAWAENTNGHGRIRAVELPLLGGSQG